MRLPVIQTCGECRHREEYWDADAVEHSCSHGQRGDFVGRVDPDQPPPSWCPLRTGPDEAELEALRAVAEAAKAARDARSAWVSYIDGGPIAQVSDVYEADDAIDAALRRLDEVRRG